ncbi:hypothetical protein [Amorphus sp. 3PC139-8]|uniref:hypothetical protein n=1 Tax=Amorphus sp. 3PC139-8 TaxID=2735676 RepID=UPI00345DEA54
MIRLVATGFALLAMASTAARAQEGWRVQITPYLWGAGSASEIQPRAGGVTFKSDMSFGDILDRLDGAFFLTGAVRHNRFVVLGDLTWVSMSEDDSITGVLPVPVSVHGKLTQTSETVAAGYSVVSRPGMTLDVVGGVRAWQIDAKVSADARIAPYYSLGAAASRDLSWVDPIVGVRMRAALSSKWSLTGYGDIGGYDGRTTWQLLGTVNYRISETFSLSAGYRQMSIDYSDSETTLDLDMGGPLVGATLRF